MKVSEIKLGIKVKDLITGITGVAFAHIKFLNGCHQIGIKQQGVNKDKESLAVEYFDIEQLEVVGDGISKKIGSVKESGGIRSARDLPTKK